MTIDTNDILNSILASLSRVDYIRPEEIPNIDLYMDQVTTFMDSQLASTKRYPDDKILTKTMINNYAKNNLLPPPVKKRYSRDHVLFLIFIYYFKNILSIKDIETVLKPLKDREFSGDGSTELAKIYDEVCRMGKDRIEPLKEEVRAAYEKSLSSFEDIPETEKRDKLKLFAFICSLSLDVYLKKSIIEKLIDELTAKEAEQNTDRPHKE